MDIKFTNKRYTRLAGIKKDVACITLAAPFLSMKTMLTMRSELSGNNAQLFQYAFERGIFVLVFAQYYERSGRKVDL